MEQWSVGIMRNKKKRGKCPGLFLFFSWSVSSIHYSLIPIFHFLWGLVVLRGWGIMKGGEQPSDSGKGF
jgi:hypothetical protein